MQEQFVQPLSFALSRPLISGLVTSRGSGGSSVGIILVTGNSHSIGRVSAEVSDVFDSKVEQWTTAGALEAIPAAILDANDTSGNYNSGDLSPMLTFANLLAINRPDLEKIVFVANGQGSTGFVDGTWSAKPSDHPNRLTDGVSRWDAAKTYLESQGYAVEPICAIHLSARPDADTVNATAVTLSHAYATAQNEYVDYLRDNLSGVSSSFPVIVSNAMTNSQASTDNEYYLFQSAGNGINRRRDRTWFLDVINDYGDGESANLPVVPFDGTHANRVGELTKGRLAYAALSRAISNTDHLEPFSLLDSWSAIESLYDFRSGTGLDLAGAYDLIQTGSDPGLIRYDSDFGTRVYDRPAGTNRVYTRPRHLPTSYTIFLRLKLDSIGTTGLLMNAGGATATQQRFYISSSNALVAGNAGNTDLNIPSLGAVAGQIFTLTLSYDSATNEMRAYKDGVQVGATATGVSDPDQTLDLYLGCQSSSYSGTLQGDIQACAIYSAKLSDAQILALSTATYNP